MATTAEYLNKLVEQKNTLADNLVAKGVTASHDETLKTLVPKVLEISSGTADSGIYPIGETGRPAGDVIVPEGVVTLSSTIFKDDSDVTSITLPSSLTGLNESCFSGCTSLQSINIPYNVSNIPNYCFYNCANLSSISGQDSFSNTSIGDNAFYNCSQLPTFTISNTCTSIGRYAFAYCNQLQNISIQENAKYILNECAFAYCDVLTNNDIANIVNQSSEIYPYIFSECMGITNVEVRIFWTAMFKRCVNLVSAKAINSAKNGTGNEVFYGCTSLEEVYLADGTPIIGSAVFKDCSSLKMVYLPSSITIATDSSLTDTSGYYYVFNNCTALEDVQLGQDWNMSLRLNVSNNLTVDSMVAMFNSLKDLTGETAKTLTLGSTNLAKLTDEQKAIAINKNWTLA